MDSLSKKQDIPRLSLDEFFLILKRRFRSYWSHEGHHYQTMDHSEKEANFIDALQKAERYILAFEKQKVPSPFEYERYRQSSNSDSKEKAEEIRRFYTEHYLTIPHVMDVADSLGINGYRLSPRAELYFRQLMVVGWTVYRRSRHKLPLPSQAIAKINQDKVNEISGPSFRESIRAMTLTLANQYGDIQNYLQDCFAIFPTLNVVCMEFGYPYFQWHGITHYTTTLPELYLRLIKNAYFSFNDALGRDDSVVGCLQQPSFTNKKKSTLQCVFFLKHDSEVSEVDWGDRLGRLWQQCVYGQGTYHNFNPEFRGHAQHAVGVIKKSETKKIKEFHYWVGGYFSMLPMYLRVGEHDPLADISLRGKLIPPSQDLKAARKEKKDKNNPVVAWGVTKKNIQNAFKFDESTHDPVIKARLAEILAIFDEKYANPFSLSWGKELQEFVLNVECFIAFVEYSQIPAFHNAQLRQRQEEADYAKYITYLGRQLLCIESSYQPFYKLEIEDKFIEKLSIRVLLFLRVVKQACQEVEQDYESAFARAEIYNVIVAGIRHQFRAQISADEPEKKQQGLRLALMVYKNRDKNPEDPDKWFRYHIQRLVPEPRPKKENDGKPETVSLKTKAPPTLRTLINQRNTVDQTTYLRACAYVEDLFKQDVWLLGFTFKFPNLESESNKSKIISGYLSSFLSVASNTQPMSFRTGYIGHWVVHSADECYARIILFFPTKLIGDINQTQKALRFQWYQFFKKQLLKLAKEQEANSEGITPESGVLIETEERQADSESEEIREVGVEQDSGEVEPKDITQIDSSDDKVSEHELQKFISERNLSDRAGDFKHSYYLMKKNNKKMQQQFKNTLVIYFVKQEQYFYQDHSNFAKGLIKGTKPRAKTEEKTEEQIQSEKNEQAFRKLKSHINAYDLSKNPDENDDK